jgi:hypothetical protein
MNRACLLLLPVALVMTLAGVARAKDLPATYRGPQSCSGKYPAANGLGAAFLHVWNGTCWSCPVGYTRTANPDVAGTGACHRSGATLGSRATRHGRGTGLIHTDCPRGQFLHLGNGSCYSCPPGYHRTLAGIGSPHACQKKLPDAWARGTRRGDPGCPSGTFRHLLSDRCYSCPAGAYRNLRLGADPSRFDACTIPTPGVKARARAGFEAERGKHHAAQARMARSLAAVKGAAGDQRDAIRRKVMLGLLANEIAATEKRNQDRAAGRSVSPLEEDWDTVTYLVVGSGSLGIGYAHGTGFAVSRASGKQVCRLVWSNTFTAGLSAGGGLVDAITYSKGGLGGVPGEINGWEASASLLLGVGVGFAWDATSGAKSMTVSGGFYPSVDVNASEYFHTWTKMGKEVPCARMVWGAGWDKL